jgi:hypothetical protein
LPQIYTSLPADLIRLAKLRLISSCVNNRGHIGTIMTDE